MKFKLYKHQCSHETMYTVDGLGRTWCLSDKGDGLSVYPEDQTFENVKREWNALARRGKHLISVPARVHADNVAEAPHIIQYNTTRGDHRTAECETDHVWQAMSDIHTLRFQPPSHITTAYAPGEVKWIPHMLWGTRSRMPVGWVRPIPNPVVEPVVPVCAICGGKNKKSKKGKVQEEHVCDTAITTIECAGSEDLTGTDGKPLSPDTFADEYYNMKNGHNGKDDRTIRTDPSPSVADAYAILPVTSEEVQRIETYLQSRKVAEVAKPPVSILGKDWKPPTRVTPQACEKPRRVLTQKPVFKNAPGLQWSRPSEVKGPRKIVTEIQRPSKDLKFRF